MGCRLGFETLELMAHCICELTIVKNQVVRAALQQKSGRIHAKKMMVKVVFQKVEGAINDLVDIT